MCVVLEERIEKWRKDTAARQVHELSHEGIDARFACNDRRVRPIGQRFPRKRNLASGGLFRPARMLGFLFTQLL